MTGLRASEVVLEPDIGPWEEKRFWTLMGAGGWEVRCGNVGVVAVHTEGYCVEEPRERQRVQREGLHALMPDGRRAIAMDVYARVEDRTVQYVPGRLFVLCMHSFSLRRFICPFPVYASSFKVR